MPSDADDEGSEQQRDRVAPCHRQRAVAGERRPGPLARRDDHQRHVHAEREERTVREIDRLHEAHHQHEAERDQREQEAQREAVDEVRDERHRSHRARALALPHISYVGVASYVSSLQAFGASVSTTSFGSDCVRILKMSSFALGWSL